MSISKFEMPNAIFLPLRLSLRTTESSPKCALSRMVTIAPKNVIQMNKKRDNSSELMMPSLKPYRSTTLPKTMMTMADSMITKVNSASRKKRSFIFFMEITHKKSPHPGKRALEAQITWYFQWLSTRQGHSFHQKFWQFLQTQFSGRVPCRHSQ